MPVYCSVMEAITILLRLFFSYLQKVWLHLDWILKKNLSAFEWPFDILVKSKEHCFIKQILYKGVSDV